MILPLILVLASGMAHAVWSMFTKRSLNKSVFLWSIMMIPTVLLSPVLVVELSCESLPVSAYALLIVSMALQALYSWLLSQTYELGDLSQIYPIMRGTSTLLVPLIGVAFLGERLSGFGWLGIACMIVGFIVLSGVGSRKGQAGSGMKGAKPVLMALCVGLCTTSYVFVDKLNLQHISPLALLEVTNIGFVAGLTPAVARFSWLASGMEGQSFDDFAWGFAESGIISALSICTGTGSDGQIGPASGSGYGICGFSRDLVIKRTAGNETDSLFHRYFWRHSPDWCVGIG